jgi:hypothetical protein
MKSTDLKALIIIPPSFSRQQYRDKVRFTLRDTYEPCGEDFTSSYLNSNIGALRDVIGVNCRPALNSLHSLLLCALCWACVVQ